MYSLVAFLMFLTLIGKDYGKQRMTYWGGGRGKLGMGCTGEIDSSVGVFISWCIH